MSLPPPTRPSLVPSTGPEREPAALAAYSPPAFPAKTHNNKTNESNPIQNMHNLAIISLVMEL